MGRQLQQRIFLGLGLAPCLLFLAVTAAAAPQQQASQPAADDCQSCHGETHDDWAESMHGRATDNRAFLLEWKRQDSPQECLVCHTTGFDPSSGEWEADGITCEVCHGPPLEDHPQTIMPSKGGAEDCGSCHVDTHIQWQVSGHGHADLSCGNCHNPHTTEIRAADSQALCRTCHNQESHFYELTAHASEGLLCTDCHLRLTDASAGEGHGRRIHTFEVDLRSCTQCHGAEMHYPVTNAMLPPVMTAETVQADEATATPSNEPLAARIVDEPQPVSGFTYILAVTVGVVLGVIIAPGLDRLLRRPASKR